MKKTLSHLISDIENKKYSFKLSPNNDLIYKKRGKKKSAQMRATLIAAEAGALVVAVTACEDDGDVVTGLAKLSGTWELDSKNRIRFLLKRGVGKFDTLTFQGAWEVNKYNEITYTLNLTPLASDLHAKHALRFKGAWEIDEKNKLTYVLAGECTPGVKGEETKSAFRIRGTFESASIRAKRGEIRYRCGIEYTGARGAKKMFEQTISLFGVWKISRALELSFEIAYADERTSTMTFGVAVHPGELLINQIHDEAVLEDILPDEVSVNLVSKTGKPLGIELVLQKNFFDGKVQAFTRAFRMPSESAVETGVAMPW